MERSKLYNHEIIFKYFNLYVLISFLGWLWETVYMLSLTGELQDRGFLTLPFCPIYATVLLGIYFLLGNITEKRGIMRNIHSDISASLIYFCLCFIFPTLAELAVGEFFLKVFGMRLWDYSGLSYNTKGHIALEISLLWAIAIFIFMNLVFTKIKRAVFTINSRMSCVVALVLLVAVLSDFVISLIKAI